MMSATYCSVQACMCVCVCVPYAGTLPGSLFVQKLLRSPFLKLAAVPHRFGKDHHCVVCVCV